ncbi:TRAP transporter substrate-binding protein [Sediminicoccus sp. KRV36]|uniref:TRAP transporter substrate-binding protein n=1 Tax=Sediminicoccus sp. KRV36 TaxID=3133721 RepID=UPI00200CAC92|nr:TRAP transporter substrate-binding protein [Sediminicoccus rosea]UPY38334.1 TRAP transporter substrate-binding protein [Sediminicoccus rosea]
MHRCIPPTGLLGAALLACGLLWPTSPQAQTEAPTMRVVGNFSSNRTHVEVVERPFFTQLAQTAGMRTNITYNPMDQVGVQAADAFRLLRSGAFDVMSVQIGMASRDDPFFEGLDLVGVSTDMAQLRRAVDAYREAFDRRLQTRFNAKVMTLWPFGPQVIYCNAPIRTLENLRGLRVRTFTPSMAALMQNFGAVAVTLQFSEVYPALQRGVAQCAITSPTSGNSGNWPEVTTHFLPLSLGGAVQGHLMNLDHWRRYSPERQAALTAEFRRMENQLWDLAISANEDAVNCNVGRDPCTANTRFRMTMVEIEPADQERVRRAAEEVVLPIWRDACNRVDPQCSATWNRTVGQVANMQIR